MKLLSRKHLPRSIAVAALIAVAMCGTSTLALGGYEPPIAFAGPDQTIYEDQTLTLAGSATGTEPLDYWWDLGDGNGFSVHDRLVSGFDYDVIGTFVARFRVSDLWGGEAIDECVITVLPRRHCTMTATIAAQPNVISPTLGAWRYAITVSWGCTTYRPNTNLYVVTFWKLDPLWPACGCEEFRSALRWESPVGASLADCVVNYAATLMCDGAPVPGGGGGRAIAVEPVARTCAGDPDGTATFDFYSDDPPETRAGEIAFWEEEANVSYAVEVTGAFPALRCGSTPAPQKTWGGIKLIYR